MLSILIVNWNTRAYLESCLVSIRRTCATLDYEVIVVDNASSDGSVDMVRDEFPEVRLFPNSSNTGFAAGSLSGNAPSGDCNRQVALLASARSPGERRTIVSCSNLSFSASYYRFYLRFQFTLWYKAERMMLTRIGRRIA